VDANDVLEIDCIDDDVIGDELMGKLSFPIAEKLRELPPDARLATWDGDFPLTDVRGLCTSIYALLVVSYDFWYCPLGQRLPTHRL